METLLRHSPILLCVVSRLCWSDVVLLSCSYVYFLCCIMFWFPAGRRHLLLYVADLYKLCGWVWVVWVDDSRIYSGWFPGIVRNWISYIFLQDSNFCNSKCACIQLELNASSIQVWNCMCSALLTSRPFNPLVSAFKAGVFGFNLMLLAAVRRFCILCYCIYELVSTNWIQSIADRKTSLE